MALPSNMSRSGLAHSHGRGAVALSPNGSSPKRGLLRRSTHNFRSGRSVSHSPSDSPSRPGRYKKVSRPSLPLFIPIPLETPVQSNPPRRPPCLLPSSLAPTPPSSSPMTASRSPYVLTLDFNPGIGMAGKDKTKCWERAGKKNKRVSRKRDGSGDIKDSEHATIAGLKNARLQDQIWTNNAIS